MGEFDVVVVGFGAAGISAAITAHDLGASVVILEKAPQSRAGGCSRVSGQVWFSPRDPELAKRYLRALSGEYPVPAPLVEAWGDETPRNTDWVRARRDEVAGRVPRDEADTYEGNEITTLPYGGAMAQLGWMDAPFAEYPELEGAECDEYNTIGPSMGFSRLWLTLRTCVLERGIEVRYGTRATGLIRGEDGGVDGVVAEIDGGETVRIRATRGVVLASGGFANNSEMARNYLRLSYVTPWGSPSNTGDGIRLAQSAGADLAHPYNFMAEPGLALPPYECGEFADPVGPSYIYVGADGRRFVDEMEKTRHGKIPMRGGFDFFPAVPMWTIFDEDARLAGPIVLPRELYAGGWLKQVERYDWSPDNSAEVERGWIVRADTLRELAQQLEIDPEGLVREVEAYNACCTEGRDPTPGRPAPTRAPLARGPFYGFRWGQVLITTLGGVRKDEHARALTPDGTPIRGLYAAGDVASTYTWALSGGQGLGDALAFSRIGVRHALGASVDAEAAA